MKDDINFLPIAFLFISAWIILLAMSSFFIGTAIGEFINKTLE